METAFAEQFAADFDADRKVLKAVAHDGVQAACLLSSLISALHNVATSGYIRENANRHPKTQRQLEPLHPSN